MADLKRLRLQRGHIKAALTMFDNFIQGLNHDEISEETIANIRDRLGKISPIFEKFDTSQLEISAYLNDEEIQSEMKEYEQFQNKYFESKARAGKIVSEYEQEKLKLSNVVSVDSEFLTPAVHDGVNLRTSIKLNNVKLPRINLPTFDGSFTAWNQFSDSFTAMIDKNSELSECQKLCYLRASLSGEPLNMIKALETTDVNYKIAWSTLSKRYDNKRRIIFSHINNIINITELTRESHVQLRNFIDTIENNIQCLKSMQLPVDHWDALLLGILINKLDTKTVRDWEAHINSSHSNNEMPEFCHFMTFLEKRLGVLEAVEFRNHLSIKTENKPKGFKAYATTLSTTCILCEGKHPLQFCEEFIKLSPTERYQKTISLKLCINCLRKGHFSSNCKSSLCRICDKKHHTLLHLTQDTVHYTVQSQNLSQTQTQKDSLNDQLSTQTYTTRASIASKGTSNAASSNDDKYETILPTVMVKAILPTGETKILKCLLDSASQSNIITMNACKKLNLPLEKFETAITGIAQDTTNLKHKTHLTIFSLYNQFKLDLSCIVIPEVIGILPNVVVNQSKLNIPPNIKLADINFCQPSQIDLLIGASHFWDLMCVGQIRSECGLMYQKTRFGWIVSGGLNTKVNKVRSFLTLNDLHMQVQDFWKVDEFQMNLKQLKPEEQFCESLFQKTTTRHTDGKFVVRMPLKQNIHDLSDTFEIAKKRLNFLERKFIKIPSFKLSYKECVDDLKIQGHVSLSTDSRDAFFLPHHAVIKNDRETTKVRVVFDGSCKTNQGISINELQYNGPVIQNDLFSIIARFRTYPYVLTADIKQMYRQIWIHPDDRKYQKFLWREDSSHPLEFYELNVVTFGMTASPFLAIRCLFELAYINEQTYPVESNIIKSDFYVDDLLTGSNTVENLKFIKHNLNSILQQAKFSLTKFKSNVAELFDDDQTNFEMPTSNKTLGVFWNPSTDTLFYSVSNLKYPKEITKRTILSQTCQLFDPLGLITPVTVIGKLTIQKLWQLKLSWDESLPMEMHQHWHKFQQNLKDISKISIPRFIITLNHVHLEMHGFSDASEKAYGACIYIKSIDQNNQMCVNLLAAKSRVAPLKNITLPRLELLAAIVLVDLVTKFKETLRISFNEIHYWCDSTIVLAWINSQPSRWKTYIANRVAHIQEFSNPKDWHHVQSENNPADIISRGTTPNLLINNNLWWKGPSFLNSTDSIVFDNLNYEEIEIPLEEVKTLKTYFVPVQSLPIDIEKFSSLNKLQGTLAWCLRFIKNTRMRLSNRNLGPLNRDELFTALMLIIKNVQIQHFNLDYRALIAKGELSTKSKLLSLCPFLDEMGILRVGGRLQKSHLPFNKKHPILLPKQHHLTKLIFRHEHIRLLHAGPNLLLNSVREQYWPISGKNTAKQTVRNCVNCFRFNPQQNVPIMGDLPTNRLTPQRPFYAVGVDYAGPFLIKEGVKRKAKNFKCYIALFICFSTKAIHIEPVTSLTTEAFIAALRRFTSRRGKPGHIHSDNGTTFVGANAEIKKLYAWINSQQEIITNCASKEGISWHFIPPYAPHFGGLWESGVKSTKYHLKRVMGETAFTFEELYTLLTQIECTINSRPLSPLSSDPNDLQPLTPAHFLVGRPLTTIADPDLQDIKVNRLSRFQYLQSLNQQFWKRWHLEYISQLQQRYKWKGNAENLKLNSMVLIKEDNSHPCQWKIGRVMELHPGQDGIVRVVTVRCSTGCVRRPVVKLCVLPISDTPSDINIENCPSDVTKVKKQ